MIKGGSIYQTLYAIFIKQGCTYWEAHISRKH